MNKKEVKKHIEKYITENFDDKWSTRPTYISEYHDYYSFGFTSKQFWETKDSKHCFIGLGSSFISKRHEDIVQFGSAMGGLYSLRDFLLTEHKLNIIRSKYKIHRYDSYFNVSLLIKDSKKAHKYINGLFDVYIYGKRPNAFQINDIVELNDLNYFGLLNLLYFNVIDTFCECQFTQIKTTHKPHLYRFHSYNNQADVDVLFNKHMILKTQELHPNFKLNANYQVKITKIFHQKQFEQYIHISLFKSFVSCEVTGYIGYGALSEDNINDTLNDNSVFEYVKGKDFLFILFMNSIDQFCEIELKELPRSVNHINPITY